jgi:Cu+-exporting ATPase
MKKKILNIEGMTCSACSNGLEKYLNKQEGIKEASVNLVMATASVEYDENIVQDSDLDRFVKEAGFKSLGERSKDGNGKYERLFLIQFALLVVLLMYISMGHMAHFPIPYVVDKMHNPIVYTVFVIVITLCFIFWGIDIIAKGFKNIFHRMPNMDSLVGVGVLVNFAYSMFNAIKVFQGGVHLVDNLYFESCAMIIFFVKLGRYIDKNNKAKAVESIKNLVTITPKNAVIKQKGKGKEKIVTINEIQKGDIVICKPGEKIAVDGKVVLGQSHTDESFITGESKPVSKTIGDTVLAGSINYDGYIEYVAENIGKDSSISHIVDLVVEATNTKAPIAKFADKISGIFVPVIFVIAILAFVLNIAITKDVNLALNALVSVLVVACPCALGLATPLAQVVALGSGTRRGIVIKTGEALEGINNIDTVIMDKTGTITKGTLTIADLYFLDTQKDNLKLLKSLETKSNHPLATSVSKGENNPFKVTDFEEIPGRGIKGKIDGTMYYAGNSKMLESMGIINTLSNKEDEFSQNGESIIYFASDKQLLGIVGLRDVIKPGIKDTISSLKEHGKKVVMLSGDNETTAKIIANEVGIDMVYSNISPKGKLEKIRELNSNQNVLMIGDGINDSPALKEATIGISVSNGTDISSDSADIMLMSEDMSKLLDVFKLGKKTMKIIKENLFWALGYNLLMVPLATGLLPIALNPMIASLAMTLSSLTVVLNSLRLRK